MYFKEKRRESKQIGKEKRIVVLAYNYAYVWLNVVLNFGIPPSPFPLSMEIELFIDEKRFF